MATLIVKSQDELDAIITADGLIKEEKVDVILIHAGHDVDIVKGPFKEQNTIL